MSVQVPKGYQQTEVGVIPEDWGVYRLGQLSEFVTSGSRGWAKYYSRSGALFIRSQNIRDGHLDLTDRQCVVPPVGAEGSRTRINFSDLLITITGNNVGNVAWVQNELGEAYISQHVGLVRLLDSSSACYICYFLAPGSFGNEQIVAGQTGQSKPGLNLTNLENFLVALPSNNKEQQAIAEALSDADALVESLEQLIAKKRQIKQGAMQELLTGQRRLPGFSREWVRKKLGDVASLYQPVTISASQFTESGYPVYGANGVVGYFNDFNHSSWQVTVTCRGSTCGTVNRTVEKCWITGNAMVVNCEESTLIDKNFIYYKLLSSDLKKCITGTGQPQIIRGPLVDFEIEIPIDVSEQRSIAEILLALDDEIDLLAQRLDKARQIKQAMMQELLTGRIRLI